VRPIRNFNEYIDEGIARIGRIDHSRAASLREESDDEARFLKELVTTTGVTERSANTIVKAVYDIIMAKIRAVMLEKGFHASGRGAHEAEVAFLREHGISESDVQFCDQLRYFRNGIMYYGKKCDAEYAEKVIGFLERMKEL